MRRLVPPWLLQLVWFLASIYAGGAFWFFLSRGEYLPAALSLAGTVVLTLVAVQLHRLNDREARFRSRREKLATFAEEVAALLNKTSAESVPTEEYGEWVTSVEMYLRTEMDASYAARFGNFSGMTFYGDGSQQSNFKNSLEGRMRRLHEFMREFAE
jgi:hypothetical protein